MKRFLKIVGMVAVLLYGLNLGLDYVISYKLQHSVDRRYIGWSKIINEQQDADLLIIGNSRAWVQYNPAILDSILEINTYNLGIDGSCFNRQIFRYEVYKHYQNKKPRWIVVNIDVFAANDWTIGYEREQFFPYMWDAYMRKEIRMIEPMSYCERFIPVYRYITYKGLYNVFREQKIDANTHKGYMGQEKTWDATEFNELKSYTCIFDERTVKVFDKFLAEQKREGIPVIFCYAPTYIGFINKIENYDEFQAVYKNFARKYDIPILDYTYHELSKDTTYFYNASHLNKQGAELFSMQLAHDLDSLGIRYTL